MNYSHLLFCGLLWMAAFTSCRTESTEKGFTLNEVEQDEQVAAGMDGNESSGQLVLRPGNVLLTAFPEYRLTPVYKLNQRKKDKPSFTGSNRFIHTYLSGDMRRGNNWHGHYMPGLEAVNGFNMLNVAHYDHTTKKAKRLFEKPGLVRTLYYPSYITDTLNHEPVQRNYLLISVYDEDTNGDSLVNYSDLRRFYYFNIDGSGKYSLVPPEYSVLSSEYDAGNDQMLVFAQKDENGNGMRDEDEDVFIFWIDLKNPVSKGMLY